MNRESFKRFYGKVKSAVKHPLFPAGALLALTAAIVMFLVLFVLPTFISMFEGMDLELPLSTVILLKIGSFLRQFWYLVLPASAWGVVLLVRFMSTRNGKKCLTLLEKLDPVLLWFFIFHGCIGILLFIMSSVFLPLF